MSLPPLKPGMVPSFHEVGADTFEDLCLALVQEEPNVESAERYGTSGQPQRGIDLLIEYKDDSLGAGQCKSHRTCDETLIRSPIAIPKVFPEWPEPIHPSLVRQNVERNWWPALLAARTPAQELSLPSRRAGGVVKLSIGVCLNRSK